MAKSSGNNANWTNAFLFHAAPYQIIPLNPLSKATNETEIADNQVMALDLHGRARKKRRMDWF